MNGNLISSSKDTDLRIGVVAALGLAIIVTATAVLSHDRQIPTEPRAAIALSASAPEFVRPPAKVVVQHLDDGGIAVE
jgi:hypothetical protein